MRNRNWNAVLEKPASMSRDDWSKICGLASRLIMENDLSVRDAVAEAKRLCR